jgi:hypothetical protein
MATWQTKVGPIIPHWTPNIRFLLLATHLHGKVISPPGQSDLFIQPCSAFQNGEVIQQIPSSNFPLAFNFERK